MFKHFVDQMISIYTLLRLSGSQIVTSQPHRWDLGKRVESTERNSVRCTVGE
jgi:hypothetical protein